MKNVPMIHAPLVITLLLATGLYSNAQTAAGIDVQHYRFEMNLSDHTDTIKATATISIKFLKRTSSYQLDLANIIDSNRKGMQVLAVSEAGKKLSFTHDHDKLRVQLAAAANAGEVRTMMIQYKGIPSDGLIISRNRYNKRTFFGDNWPNRARYWLACNDTPADKASLEFIITAPKHYSIVSNGIKIEEISLNDSTKRTHWKEDVQLPTKVMVIGAADFIVSDPVYAGKIPVTSWIYEEEKQKGFSDYAFAPAIVDYFSNYIGPYGYKKLANVQSKTRFGGMENAGAIFYFESSISGTAELESLLAHEIAHQWFGDMVTETDFKHLWLSEGFASYMTDLYFESKYGTDSLRSRLKEERDTVVSFSSRITTPVIDTNSNYMHLLNPNSYQKGAWVLHMLRNTVGDKIFKEIIREQYRKYAGRNSSSEDFVATAERVSHKNLRSFFNQWLYRPGQPVLQTTWKYNSAKRSVQVTVEQKQASLFSFPVELLIKTKNGEVRKTLPVQKREAIINIPVKGEVIEIVTDPDCKLLWKKYTGS